MLLSPWFLLTLFLLPGPWVPPLGAEDRSVSDTDDSPDDADAHSGFWSGLATRTRAALSSSDLAEQPDEALVRKNLLRWNRVVHDALALPPSIELAGVHRVRFESVSHPWRAGQSSNTDHQLLLQTRLRAGLSQGPYSFLFEGQESTTHFEGRDSFSRGAVENRADVLQLFASASFPNVLDSDLRADVHVGRFAMDVGSRRLIGRNGFPNTTNSFQGTHLALGLPSSWRLRAFFTSPVQRRVFQRDRGSTERFFWGTIFEFSQLEWLKGESYYLGLSDRKPPSPSRSREFSTFGTRLYRPEATDATLASTPYGVFDYDFEGALQSGESRGRDLLAYLLHAEVGYTASLPWAPRLAAELTYVSGSDDPTSSRSETFDPLFGLRVPDLHATSIFGPFRFSNIQSIGARFQVRPHGSLKLHVRYRNWHLLESRDALVSSRVGSAADLQDPTGAAGDSLGHTLELAGTWALSSNVAFEAGYVHWFKGSYFDRLPPAAGLPPNGEEDTDYFFAQTSVRF